MSSIERLLTAMFAIRDLPISQKFVYAFGLVCTLCLVLGAFTLMAFRDIAERNRIVSATNIPAIAVLDSLNRDFRDIRREDQNVTLRTTPEFVAKHMGRRKTAIEHFQSDLKEYENYIQTPEQRDLYRKIVSNGAQLQDISDRSQALLALGQVKEAGDLLTDDATFVVFDATKMAVLDSYKLNVESGTENALAATKASQRATWVNLSATLCIFLLCGLVGIVLTRLIVPPLVATTKALEKLAGKDLSARVEAVGQDEVGRLSQAVNVCADEMRDVLQAVTRSAEMLSASAAELSTQSLQTSGNIETQTSKINQIAAAAQEMTATIGEISQSSELAAASSRGSAAAANQSGVVMQSAARTMEKISTSTTSVAEKIGNLAHRSEDIGKVVTVIQEISEQTNLLALNAAIEAARAGEHGRGFAVVAGEVRRLAERTKGATEEIAVTIRSIQTETRETLEVMSTSRGAVANGMSETANASDSLKAIISSSKDIEMQVNMIATAANQQTAASSEISESANQISSLAIENSQAARETADASKNLSLLANDLNGIVGEFRLDQETSHFSTMR